jgi:hypothetical protein
MARPLQKQVFGGGFPSDWPNKACSGYRHNIRMLMRSVRADALWFSR